MYRTHISTFSGLENTRISAIMETEKVATFQCEDINKLVDE